MSLTTYLEMFGTCRSTAEAEAYGKIKMVLNGQVIVAYGVLYRWFTDVSSFGFAEQTRMLMHPAPPRPEEELAEHVDM